MSQLPHPELTATEGLESVGPGGRSHVPSNELTAEGYAPIYHNTKERMERVFGNRSAHFWNGRQRTCSGCYSVMPPLSDLYKK